MKEPSTHAFTLTELLVVVPVAVLLTTMLFAVSNDATQQLQAAACLNNMRQWSLGFMLYANDYRDYVPYDGDSGSPCDPANAAAWFNLIPPYIGQKTLCTLYNAAPPTPPTPLTKSVWSCPSATNVTVQPTLSYPYFMYSINDCWHRGIACPPAPNATQRNRATSPSNTILFCEEPEDNYSTTSGLYDTVRRHFGGSNFVFADGHAGWLTWTNFCRSCPANQFSWDNSSPTGDWNPTVKYHWWPFAGAAEGCN